MGEFCKDDDSSFTNKHIKRRTEEYFGDEILITSINGKSNVVTLRSTADNILQKFYETPKVTDTEAEKLRIIETAASLIKNDIKSIQSSKEPILPRLT